MQILGNRIHDQRHLCEQHCAHVYRTYIIGVVHDQKKKNKKT